jgi:magnesium transporter
VVSSPFSAVLAHFILNERLHALGVLGCVMFIAGSVVIVIHAPQEQEITSVREIWNMATQPGENYLGCHPVLYSC